MKYILNIGVNNTSYSKIIEQLNNARTYYFEDYHSIIKIGTYKGASEPTAVITFETSAHYTSILILIEKWCTTLAQECISLNISDGLQSSNHMIYNKDYKGLKQSFNIKYFLT